MALSPEKAKIIHITEGFDFLGQNIRIYSRGKLLISSSKDAIKSVKEKLKRIIVKHRGSQAGITGLEMETQILSMHPGIIISSIG